VRNLLGASFAADFGDRTFCPGDASETGGISNVGVTHTSGTYGREARPLRTYTGPEAEAQEQPVQRKLNYGTREEPPNPTPQVPTGYQYPRLP